MSQLFTWGGQSIRVSASASVLPMNTQISKEKKLKIKIKKNHNCKNRSRNFSAVVCFLVSFQYQTISFQLVLVVKVYYCPSHSVSALMAEFDLAAPVTSGQVGPPWLDFYFLCWEVSFMSTFWSEVRGWLPLIRAQLFSGAIRRLGTLKANTTVICGCAWGGWTKVGLPLPKVTCIYWVHTA